MNSALRSIVLVSLLAWTGTSTLAADLTSFPLPASDSAAVHRIYGIGVFANPASKASMSVDAGVLRAEFDLTSDSTEGYSARVGLFLPLSTEDVSINLGNSGGAPFRQIQFEYRLSAKVTDVLDWTVESEAYPSQYRVWAADGVYYSYSMGALKSLSASVEWQKAILPFDDFWSTFLNSEYPPDDFPSFDSILTQATALRIEPKSLYSASGFQNGTACTKCVNPTMKHLVMELRNIRIDRIGPAGDTIPLELGLPKAQVGVVRRAAAPAADVFWQRGVLRIAQPSRWASVSVLAPDGRHLRTLVSSAEQPLELPPGNYHLLLRGPGGIRAVRNLIRLR